MLRKRKGFTLIELLVVIAIIAILASILLPVFMMARAKARATDCISNLKQFSSAFAMYEGDWDQKFPTTAIPKSGWTKGQPNISNPRVWVHNIDPYLQKGSVVGSTLKGVFQCKDREKLWAAYNRESGIDPHSYGYNFLFLGLPYKAWDTSNYYAPFGFKAGACKVSRLGSPAETIVLVESRYVWAFPPRRLASGNQFIRPRHNGRSSVMWADGHCTAMQTALLVGTGSGRSFGMRRPGIDVPQATDNSLWDRE